MREQEGGNQPFTSLLIQSVKVERDFREFGSERLLTLSVGGEHQLHIFSSNLPLGGQIFIEPQHRDFNS